MDTNIYIIRLDSVKRKIVQNLVEAGLIEPNNTPWAMDAVSSLAPDEMLVALMDSEQMHREATNRIKFFPVDVREISLS